MTGARALLMVLAVLAALTGPAPARAADERVVPLSGPADGAARAELAGEIDHLDLTVMVPPTAPLRQVVLSLQYENGIDLLPERSRLLLSLNGEPLAELPLSAYRGPVTASISLPPGRLRPGANRITLRQEAQHRAFCNVRGTFDLWTRINLDRSSLVLRSDGAPPAPDLAMLPQLLAASDRAASPLAVLRVGEAMRPDHLGWGALAAQAYALTLGDRAPRVITVALPAPPRTGEAAPVPVPGPAMPGPKSILIGTRDELSGVLAPPVLQGVTGPFLGVYPVPDMPGGFVLVASGRTPEEVDRALLRLADPGRPLPPQAAVVLDGPPEARMAPPPDTLGEGRYRLSRLGFETATHTGYRYSGRLTVRLPADYRPVADRTIALRVNAAFEGEIGPGAVLNVRINGRIGGAIEVDRRSSGDIRRAEMRLPMNLFRPGPNRIEFDAELPPAQETDCLFAVRKPTFTLFDSSELEIPGFARLVGMPDLGTTARTGFPFVRPDEGSRPEPFDLVVAGQGDAWHGVALTLVARLAQSAGEVLHPVPSVGWTAPGTRDALIVGPVTSLPQAALDGTRIGPDRLASLLEAGTRISQAEAAGEPLPDAERRRIVERLRAVRGAPQPAAAGQPVVPSGARNGAARWETPADRTVPPPDDGSVSLTALVGRLIELVGRAGAADDTSHAAESLTLGADDMLPDTALLQFRAPTAGDATWTVLTGADPGVVARAAERLVTAPLWTMLEGGAALWRSTGGGMDAIAPAARYSILVNRADLGNLFLIVASHLSQRIDVLFGLLLGAVVVLAFTIHILLRLGRTKED
ncbi:cellulose biosynthesis cyclic di-GMP-binding regulatory protein BcsB [Azospirillum halopraeferens]|uniref:cellulose biosynthesis cyclic di-GMP-binding regulatory protein BcsB n=1 Tax=Azospirillum halopraeferens TaxID=34010 RepID=UPI000403B80D|nr:cellulose biosynthesis cyclic di-GMP-binding regulatory protein BcsB [Azospirillum halopraeferens]